MLKCKTQLRKKSRHSCCSAFCAATYNPKSGRYQPVNFQIQPSITKHFEGW